MLVEKTTICGDDSVHCVLFPLREDLEILAWGTSYYWIILTKLHVPNLDGDLAASKATFM